MDKDIKISNEQLENIKKELQNGNADQNTEALMQKFLNKEQTETVKKVLANPDKVKEIMQSPLAKSLMEKFGNQKKE